jgi:hypothetical protein
MQDITFVGLDVHKAPLAVWVAGGDGEFGIWGGWRTGPRRYAGWWKFAAARPRATSALRGLHRQLTELGQDRPP